MANRTAEDKHRTRTILLLAACIAAPTLHASGQGSVTPTPPAATPTRPLAFEVVSIRRNKAGGPPGHFGPTEDGFSAINLPLIGLVQMAYIPTGMGDGAFFRGDRILGAPAWFQGDERYDVQAKVAESDLAEWHKPAAQPAMLRAMLQAVLTERCNAVVHRDLKEVPIYALVVAKNGPKLQPASTLDPAELRAKHPGAIAVAGGTLAPDTKPGHVDFFASPIGTLVQVLTGSAGRPIEDHTGLTGRYDFSLQWNQPRGNTDSDDPDAGPSVFTAVQEQLGLRLDPAKGNLETLVIDHVDRPTEN